MVLEIVEVTLAENTRQKAGQGNHEQDRPDKMAQLLQHEKFCNQ